MPASYRGWRSNRWLRRFPEFRLAYVQACYWREFMLGEEAIEVAMARGRVDLAGAKREVAKLDERIGLTFRVQIRFGES